VCKAAAEQALSAPGAVTLMRQPRGAHPWPVATARTSASDAAHRTRLPMPPQRHDANRTAAVRADELLLVCVQAWRDQSLRSEQQRRNDKACRARTCLWCDATSASDGDEGGASAFTARSGLV
jgi:hypothetical protein